MSDIGVAEIPVDEDERPLPPPKAPEKNALLDGPILRTLLWLAWPNVIALTAGTCVVIAAASSSSEPSSTDCPSRCHERIDSLRSHMPITLRR